MWSSCVPRDLLTIDMYINLFFLSLILLFFICFFLPVSDINGLGKLRDWYPDYCVSPLRAAVENDNLEVINWLCSNGADTNYPECVCSIYNSNYVSTSCFSNFCSVPCHVPLHFARSSACVDILLAHGASLNAQDCMGKTPLSMATLNGRLDVMEKLCKEGADVGLGSIWGAAPLAYAQYTQFKKDRIAATEILCRFGADVNFQDRNGRTCLHVAKDVECVQIVLAYGADPSFETIFGKTAIITAAENDLWSIVWILYDAEVRTNIGLLSSGVSLFSSLPVDVLTWLLKASNDVRDLTHLCRSVIRSQLLRKKCNIDEAIACLPIPPRVKFYLALWYHTQDSELL